MCMTERPNLTVTKSATTTLNMSRNILRLRGPKVLRISSAKMTETSRNSDIMTTMVTIVDSMSVMIRLKCLQKSTTVNRLCKIRNGPRCADPTMTNLSENGRR